MFSRFQLDSSDEQAAAIRRELDARREKVSEMERVSSEHYFDIITNYNYFRIGN